MPSRSCPWTRSYAAIGRRHFEANWDWIIPILSFDISRLHAYSFVHQHDTIRSPHWRSKQPHKERVVDSSCCLSRTLVNKPNKAKHGLVVGSRLSKLAGTLPLTSKIVSNNARIILCSIAVQKIRLGSSCNGNISRPSLRSRSSDLHNSSAGF